MVQSGKKTLRKIEPSPNEEKQKKNGKNFTLIEENTFLGAMIAPQKCLEYTMISMTNMT